MHRPSDPALANTVGQLDPLDTAPTVHDVNDSDGKSNPLSQVDPRTNLSLSRGDDSRYETGPLLGRGGMGEVVLNLDRRIGRPVARKTLLGTVRNERTLARFVREARVQGQLEHPAVVPVYDFGVDAEGSPFFTMKRVRGQTLAHILERLAARDPVFTSRFSRRKLLSAFMQACLAIEYAHERGVAHRDLKPSNLMLGDFGEVYVLDWGLAKLSSDVATARAPSIPDDSVRDVNTAAVAMTRHGDMLGTPSYMAPEQFPGGQSVPFDVRADVFALGAILFEILTLQVYRRGVSIPEIVLEASAGTVRRPSEVSADVPVELDLSCAAALAPDPKDRLPSAAALANAVERYLEGDRDMATRKTIAATLLESARGNIASKGAADVSTRVGAMRDALKALALLPDDREAQELLLELVVDGSGKLPPEAEQEFEMGDVRTRAHGVRVVILTLVSWLALIPVAIWIGVRDWTVPATMAVLTSCGLLYALRKARSTRYTSAQFLGMSALLATVVVLSSSLVGPFVVVPIASCAASTMFVTFGTRGERRWVVATWGVATLVPYLVELLRVFPPAYTFAGGDIVLHPRALALPEIPVTVSLAYTSLAFILFSAYFVGGLRDKQREGDRRMFVQAWHLRQLFPDRGASVSPPRG
jgi:serine/threonine-protein kinase